MPNFGLTPSIDLNQEELRIFPSVQPQPINLPLPSVQTLDPQLLPEGLRGWLCDIAHRKQVPLDYPAAVALTVLSGLVGAKVAIKPKRRDDWMVVPNMWGALIGPPSAMKTPVITDVLKPIRLLEKKAEEEYRSQLVHYEVDLAQHEANEKQLKKQLTDSPKAAEELKTLLATKPTKPQQRRFLVNDATVEKLGVLLNDNPGGLTVVRDELAGLLSSWQKAGHEQDRAFYLEAWNGTGSFLVDRISRESLSVKTLCLSLFGSIQPDKLVGYFQSIQDRDNDGMLQRFQLAVYPDILAQWQYVDEFPSKESRDRAYEIFGKLADFDYQNLAEEDLFAERPYLVLDFDAQHLLQDWLISLETRLRGHDLHPFFEEHLGKYRSLVPSLALLFHVVDWVTKTTISKQITAESLRRAIYFTEYLESHAHRIYAMLGANGRSQGAAYELSKRIANGKLQDGFTARSVQQAGWRGLSDLDSIREAIATLVESGWLFEAQPLNRLTGGRPASPTYAINPLTRDFYKNA